MAAERPAAMVFDWCDTAHLSFTAKPEWNLSRVWTMTVPLERWGHVSR